MTKIEAVSVALNIPLSAPMLDCDANTLDVSVADRVPVSVVETVTETLDASVPLNVPVSEATTVPETPEVSVALNVPVSVVEELVATDELSVADSVPVSLAEIGVLDAAPGRISTVTMLKVCAGGAVRFIVTAVPATGVGAV